MPSGPLAGVHVVELGGVGPAPFAAMVLADLGADVIRVDRVEHADESWPLSRSHVVNGRSRRSIAVDLKTASGGELVLQLVERAHVLIEGFRPGVAERLGVGPTPCRERNPALVYVRATGWGQEGPYAASPGHDLNYIGTTGVLEAIGDAAAPPPVPLNVIGDYGGGGMLAALGAVAGLFEARSSGVGQVVDACIVDGVALMTTLFHGQLSTGEWNAARGTNSLNGAAPWYGVYETADERYVTVAAGEPQFYRTLLAELGLDEAEFPQYDTTAWPELRSKLAAIFRSQPQSHWARLTGGPDQCIAPVWSFSEAPADPHNAERDAYVTVDGVVQPAAAPRFERTPGCVKPLALPGQHTRAALVDWGVDEAIVASLLASGVIEQRLAQQNDAANTQSSPTGTRP